MEAFVIGLKAIYNKTFKPIFKTKFNYDKRVRHNSASVEVGTYLIIVL